MTRLNTETRRTANSSYPKNVGAQARLYQFMANPQMARLNVKVAAGRSLLFRQYSWRRILKIISVKQMSSPSNKALSKFHQAKLMEFIPNHIASASRTLLLVPDACGDVPGLSSFQLMYFLPAMDHGIYVVFRRFYSNNKKIIS